MACASRLRERAQLKSLAQRATAIPQQPRRDGHAAVPAKPGRMAVSSSIARKSVRSELGRQVAVDLETDADFDESRGRPSHGVPPQMPAAGREKMQVHLGSSGLACK